jgi:geranylgeranylglycerol-phosphate geranylgeranyltransferase
MGAALAVLLGVYLAGSQSQLLTKPALLAGAVVWLIVAGNNIVNDLRDLPVDRLQKPHRALPSGRLRTSTASLMAWVLFISSLILASLINIDSFLVALFAIVLGIVYSVYLKNSVLLGNVVVGLLSGLAVIYGGLAVSGMNNWVSLAAGIVFAFVFVREILKTIADIDGDSQSGINTIATQLGSRRALKLFSWLVVLFVIVVAIPWLMEYATYRYLVTIYLGVCLPLAGAAVLLWARFSQTNLRLALSLTKMAWFLGLFALSNLR